MRSLQFPVSLAVLVSCCFHIDQAQAEPLPAARVTFYSQSVAREMGFNIILPASYEKSGKRYPVLYLLHGRNGNLDSWTEMGVPEYAAGYGLIVVMPDAGNSWYVNWVESEGGEKNDWADYITKDLIGFVDAHYRTIAAREGRAIDGFSMGGYGALFLAFSHPELFCSVNSHSAALRIMERWRERLEEASAGPAASENSSTPEEEAEGEPAASLKGYTPKGRIVANMDQCDAIDPYKLVLAVPPEQLPDIRIDCGMDESLAEFSQRLAKLLMEHKIPFTYAQAPGRHNAENWTRAVKHSMAHQYAVMMNQLGGALPDEASKTVGADTPKGWMAPPAVLEALEARERERNQGANFREERIPKYTLPDSLLSLDATKITTADAWWRKRRPEVLELFRKNVHGRSPLGKLETMTFEMGAVDGQALGGKATRTDLAVNLTGKPSGPRMDMRVYVPNDAAKPVPAFLYLGRPLNDDSGGAQSRWSDILPEIIARGYALAVIDREGIDPDEDDGFKNGLHGAFDPPGDRPTDAWGTISAWAWGLSRALDYLETNHDLDHTRVAVMGVSRAGKTALWAGAQDQRFAMTISICSGAGGAALSRRRYGNPNDVMNDRHPHWFCENFKSYNDKEDDLPVDQHMLMALIAPRLLYVSSADEDLWADPRGEFLSSKHADPVYHLLGVKGLEAEHMPPLESPIQVGRIGYHIRTGGHGLNEYDWRRYMDFADKHWKEK
ncbi:alpha/beta hydrolase-fold protein [Acidobacteria bacterium AH-259-A15]|nr:alpha/beta hydrolase-fold protein [Acidobacteria bacterium AH-259-A15]